MVVCEIGFIECLLGIIVFSLIDLCYNKNSFREYVCGYYVNMRMLFIECFLLCLSGYILLGVRFCRCGSELGLVFIFR